MKAIDRLFIYLESKGIKPTNLEKRLGLSNGYLKKQLDRSASIGSNVLEKIVYNLDDLNPIWLLMGEGDMLKSSGNPNGNLKGNPNVHLTQKRGELTPRIEQVAAVPADANGYTPKLTAIAGNKWVPIIPAAARAGYLSYIKDPEWVEYLKHYSIVGLVPGIHRGFEVYGDSMEPLILPNDIAIGRLITEPAYMRDKNVYVIVAQEDIVIKRIINRINTQGIIECHSDNEYYPFYELRAEEIREIYIVEAILRRSIGAPDSNLRKIRELELEIQRLKELKK